VRGTTSSNKRKTIRPAGFELIATLNYMEKRGVIIRNFRKVYNLKHYGAHENIRSVKGWSVVNGGGRDEKRGIRTEAILLLKQWW
jgi:hypothetical protein